MTVYFAKINLVTPYVYEIQKDSNKLQELFNTIELYLNDGCIVSKIHTYQMDRVTYTDEIDYMIRIFSKNNLEIEGNIIKTSTTRYKQINPETNELERKSVPSNEVIHFFYDIKSEAVGFNTSNRFGYKEFCEAFQDILNKCMEKQEKDLVFNVDLFSREIRLNDLKNEIAKLNGIKEITFRIKAINPNESEIDELLEHATEKQREMEEANVTITEQKFMTKGNSSLNLDSKLIQSQVQDSISLVALNDPDMAVSKGRVHISAKDTRGETYSTSDKRPYKCVVDGIEEIIVAFKSIFMRHL